jgi:hypothetical protein
MKAQLGHFSNSNRAYYMELISQSNKRNVYSWFELNLFQTRRYSHQLMAYGLVISTTDPIRSFLVAASGDRDHLSDELRGFSASLLTLSSVPYKSIRSVWCALPASSRPSLRLLLDGSDFVFTRPKPREKKVFFELVSAQNLLKGFQLYPQFEIMYIFL